MGASTTKIVPSLNTNTLQALLSQQPTSLPPPPSLSILLAKITSTIKFEKQQKLISPQSIKYPEMELTPTIIKLFWHQNFENKGLYWYNYLRQYIGTLLVKKSMMFVTADQWRLCLGLSQFVMLICDDNIRDFLNSLDQISITQQPQPQLQPQPQPVPPTALKKPPHQLTHIQPHLSSQQQKQTKDKYRQFIYYSIYAKNKLVPNVSVSFTQIYRTIECILNLYVKLQIIDPDNQGFKRNIILCTYCIGIGVEYDNCLIVDLCVRLLIEVLRKVLQVPEILVQFQTLPPIPITYFTQLPTLSCKNLYESTSTFILYAIKTKKTQINIQKACIAFQLMENINRSTNKQIILFMKQLSNMQGFNQKEQICLRTIMKNYVIGQEKDRKKQGGDIGEIKNFLGKESEKCEVKSVGSDTIITQAYKTKGFTNFPNQNPSIQVPQNSLNNLENVNSPNNLDSLHSLYHKIVIKRFLPNIHQQSKQYENEQNIQFPRIYKNMIPMQLQQQVQRQGYGQRQRQRSRQRQGYGESLSKNNSSEEESLQNMNCDKNYKYGGDIQIQEIQ